MKGMITRDRFLINTGWTRSGERDLALNLDHVRQMRLVDSPNKHEKYAQPHDTVVTYMDGSEGTLRGDHIPDELPRTMIPAYPGFFVVNFFPDGGTPDEYDLAKVDRDEVIAWEVYDEFEVNPVTCEGVQKGVAKGGALLTPSGVVYHEEMGGRFDDMRAWVKGAWEKISEELPVRESA